MKILFSFALTLCIFSVSAQHTKLIDLTATTGSEPCGSLIFDGAYLYGMTNNGGSNNLGTIFKVMPDGTGFLKLLDFESTTSGAAPHGSLLSDGTFLYGMTTQGGVNNLGTIFKIRTDGTGFAKLLDFNGTGNGSQPWGSFISDGTFLYGMTSTGGTSNLGTLFKILPDGTGYTKLIDFTSAANGSQPLGSLLYDGTFLYGMTGNGGTNNDGTIFKIRPDGTGYVKLLNFSRTTTGEEPFGDLVTDGTFLYGMTPEGGTASGTIFKIKPDGSGFAKIFDFVDNVTGDTPYGSLILKDGLLYGGTYFGGLEAVGNHGTIFSIKPDGTEHTVLQYFDDAEDGEFPVGSLVANGTFLYCMTQQGGATFKGTIFSYELPPAPVAIPGLQWAVAQTGSLDTFTEGMTVDPFGNVYTVGEFSETTDFDPGSGVFNLTSAGNFDIYVSKLNPNGDLEWAFRLGNPNHNAARNVTSDAAGNIYVTGNFSETIDFDPGAGTTELTGPGVFICKYSPDGNLLWARQMNNNLSGELSILVDANNIYMGGGFTGTADFDPEATVFNLTSLGSTDIFILKLSTNGDLIWVKQMGGTLPQLANRLALDAAGNIYSTGAFSGTVDFDPGTGTVNLTSAGGNDIFISKLDPSGNYVWAKRAGSTGTFDIGYGIAMDADNNVLVTGPFTGTVDFDPGASVINLTSAGDQDVFVLKLTSAGNFIWVKNMGGLNTDISTSITTDAARNVYTAGFYRNTADFDPGPGTFEFTTGINRQTFISKLDSNGDFLWALSTAGTPADAELPEIFLDASENIIVSGYFENGSIDFDPGACVTELSANFVGGFIIKLNPTSIPGCGPAITSFTPTSGPEGTTVTIIGIRFSTTPANNTVQFNGTAATVTASSTSSITTAVPPNATTGKITVVVAGNTATSIDDFTLSATVNQPPVISATTTAVPIEGIISIDLEPLMSDPDNNLDPSSLYLVNSVSEQGASAGLGNGSFILTLNYGGIQFFGTDRITVGVCDLLSECVEQQLTIEVGGDIVVYNALSPDGNGLNDILFIQYVDVLPGTVSNRVTIFNRWGDVVFDVRDYNNQDRVFKGVGKNGSNLPSGTYYYKIEFPGGRKTKTGYLSLKR